MPTVHNKRFNIKLSLNANEQGIFWHFYPHDRFGGAFQNTHKTKMTTINYLPV